jgi:integrase
MNRQSDYINFDTALRKGKELLKNEKTSIIGFYIIFSINVGMRVSDVLKLKHFDLIGLKENDNLIVQEKKTKKTRIITINSHIAKAYAFLVEELIKRNQYNPDGYIFVSQKKTVYITRSLNRVLKDVFGNSRLNISTHSLRKSFGRKVYENNSQSEHSLVLLSEIFLHSNVLITRKYLGLRQEEIGNVYLSL